MTECELIEQALAVVRDNAKKGEYDFPSSMDGANIEITLRGAIRKAALSAGCSLTASADELIVIGAYNLALEVLWRRAGARTRELRVRADLAKRCREFARTFSADPFRQRVWLNAVDTAHKGTGEQVWKLEASLKTAEERISEQHVRHRPSRDR